MYFLFAFVWHWFGALWAVYDSPPSECLPCSLLRKEPHSYSDPCPLLALERDRGARLADLAIPPLTPPVHVSGSRRGGFHTDVAQRTLDGQMVSVKLPRSCLCGPGEYERSCNEALIMKEVSHIFVLPINAVYVVDGKRPRLAMVSPWCEVDSLNKHLSVLELAGAIDGGQILRLLIEVATALSYVHSRNIVHNGIHPSNVYTTATGRVQLAGFRSSVPTSSALPNTYPSSVYWGYCSPQKFRHHLQTVVAGNEQDYMADPSDDMFAFGTLMYVLYAANQHPFGTKSYSMRGTAAQRFLDGERPARPELADCRVPLPDAVWAMVQRCWAHNPGARPTAEEAVYGLSDINVD